MSKQYADIAIIGAGPAGLLAAWGASVEGANEIHIFDRDPAYRPERIFSLQFLHESCGLDYAVRRIQLHYEQQGKVRFGPDMARRHYNLKLNRPVGEPNSTRFLHETPVTVWSMKDAYSWLHKHFAREMHEQVLSWDDILKLCNDVQIVINTAPLNRLLPSWEWPTREHAIVQGYSPVEDHPENTCYYNLDAAVPWYRATRLDGGTATEYTVRPGQGIVLPKEAMKNYRTLRKVVKAPQYPAIPDNLILAGRWGSWDPDALTHHAYRTAREQVRKISAIRI